MKKWIAVAGLLGLVWCPKVGAQHSHTYTAMIGPAEDLGLMMMFPAGYVNGSNLWAGVPFNFPNDYAISTYATNATGQMQWTETYTGEMTGPGMPNNIYHTPKGTLTIKGSLGTTTFTYSGNGVTPYAHMNESNTYTWDWESVCSETDLEDGDCTGETQPYIYCPMLGGAIFSDPHGMEAEEAITDFIVPAQSRNGKVNCSPQSTPPDWIGPFTAPDFSDVDRQYRAANYGYRYCLNPPCKGLLWTFAGPVKKSRQIPVSYLLDCTVADKGIKPAY